jgi:hypothetical protein
VLFRVGQQAQLGDLESELGPRPSWRLTFPNQAAQVVWLRRMVDHYRGEPLLRAKAHQIVFELARCQPRDRLCHCIAIARWVQDNITYVNEGIETFQSPVETLTSRYGDCDDFTTLIASLVESIGIPCQLVALEWDGEYRHIFPRAVLSGLGPGGTPLELPLDATLTGGPVGAPLQNPLLILAKRGTPVRQLAL